MVLAGEAQASTLLMGGGSQGRRIPYSGRGLRPPECAFQAQICYISRHVGPLRPVAARFNDEAMTVQNWPAKEGHIVFAEFHY